MNRSEKIAPVHLQRKAIVYIRQSTMRQVVMNTESAVRQYALKERLARLGWDESMIEIIDCDLGRSGAETSDRDGFRQMLADVGEGIVGAIASIECSRLSRSSGDWGRLMEICALSGTILIDDDGIYDPNDFNDRLLLGLKGTMSEAELHFLRERMRGGALSKAKRGELRCLLGVGYLHDEAGNIIKDPDMQVQNAVKMFFESFRICGSAHSLAVYYSEKGYLFPANRSRGFGKSDIYWDTLTPTRAGKIISSPTYAGVYSYGKIQRKNTVKGKKLRSVPEEEWVSYIENHHEAYITLEEWRENIALLRSNCTKKGASPPREGNALLQGMVICSRCGRKMSVHYDGDAWAYICSNRAPGKSYTGKNCQRVYGCGVDEAVSKVILQRLTPEAIRAADEVLREIEKRKLSEDSYFLMQTEKAKYESDLAKKRYMSADPENRLVSAELERLWNEKMTRLVQAEAELRKYRASSEWGKMKTETEKLLEFPEKLHKAWSGNALHMPDKKRILRHLVEDIALNNIGDEIQVGIRFKGGLCEAMTIPRALPFYAKTVTPPDVVEYIREASKKYMVDQIAEQLNNLGKKTGTGLDFDVIKVRDIAQRNNIMPLTEYLHSTGYLSTAEKANQLGISTWLLNDRRRKGEYDAVRTSRTGDYMFKP